MSKSLWSYIKTLLFIGGFPRTQMEEISEEDVDVLSDPLLQRVTLISQEEDKSSYHNPPSAPQLLTSSPQTQSRIPYSEASQVLLPL
jgi:hypothetical protein